MLHGLKVALLQPRPWFCVSYAAAVGSSCWLQVVIPLLQALQVVHQQGVIHRDIKPENLFLTERGALRLGDWGLAINQLQEKPYSRVGTLDYMAPEVHHVSGSSGCS